MIAKPLVSPEARMWTKYVEVTKKFGDAPGLHAPAFMVLLASRSSCPRVGEWLSNVIKACARIMDQKVGSMSTSVESLPALQGGSRVHVVSHLVPNRFAALRPP